MTHDSIIKQKHKTDASYNKAVIALENLVSREEVKEEKVMEESSQKVGKNKPTLMETVDPAGIALKRQREASRLKETGFQGTVYRGRGIFQGRRPGRRGRGRRPSNRPY